MVLNVICFSSEPVFLVMFLKFSDIKLRAKPLSSLKGLLLKT